ncbi:MAG: hypothetical protein NTZ33_07310 [Bacteroidetes bacterium]|nr:hypothetical protein [Bacteroidota bacterium]
MLRKNTVIQLILSAIVVVLAVYIYNSIMNPLKFKDEVSRREAVVIEKLKDIRTMQLAYKSVYGIYAANFDTLIHFVKEGKMPIVKRIGNVPDSLTEEQALKLKLISRDTIYINTYQVLFNGKKDFDLENIRFIPNTKREFSLNAITIAKNAIEVPVFEVTASYNAYLEGLDSLLVKNLIIKAQEMNKFAGLKLGSMEEPSYSGNWE